MHDTSRRRIVRRTVMVLAVVVLLPGSYLCCWFGAHWLYGRRAINRTSYEKLRSTVFAPVVLFEISDLPGADLVYDVSVYCELKGAGSALTWDDVHVSYD